MRKTALILLFFFVVSAAFSQPQTQSQPAQVSDTLRAQILLDRAGFSCGEIDGVAGTNTRRALSAFQEKAGMQPTGRVTAEVLELLGAADFEPLISYTITPEDIKGPYAQEIPEDMMEKGELPALSYTSPLEQIAEKFHVSPGLLQKLNPGAQMVEGEQIQVPNIDPTLPEEIRDLTITVSQKNSDLTVTNGQNEVLFYAPVTSGSEHDPLPLGTWKVEKIIHDPEFFYNPELFWDADPAHSKAKIAPGPNNPAGVVWIDITAEHYGLHGTPEPDKIGHSESYGCVRMTNWDARKLAALILPGTEVVFSE